MMRPVGVGLMSRGPMGVDGATITAGKPFLRDHALDFAFGHQLAALVGADDALRRVARGFVHRLAIARLQRRDRRGIDHPLDAGLAAPPAWWRGRRPDCCARSRTDRAPRAGNPPRHGKDSARPAAPRVMDAASRISPVDRLRHPGPRYWRGWRWARISTLTLKPRASAARATAAPTKPDAPVTSTVSAHRLTAAALPAATRASRAFHRSANRSAPARPSRSPARA